MPTKGQVEKEHLCPASRNKRSIAEAGRKRIDIRNCCSIVASVCFYLKDLALLDCVETLLLRRSIQLLMRKQNNCCTLHRGLQILKSSALSHVT